MRWKNPELDKIIEGIQQLDFDDPKAIDLGIQFVKLAAQEMPIIPIMSYNVFSVCDQTYWTGFPTAEDPYTDPVPNWANIALHVRQDQVDQGIVRLPSRLCRL